MNNEHQHFRTWPTDEGQLYKAILSLHTKGECFAFFRDLCTPAEIHAMKERWRIAQLLNEGELSYRQIQKETNASLATITRVARFLNQESYNGYKIALARMPEPKKQTMTVPPEQTLVPS